MNFTALRHSGLVAVAGLLLCLASALPLRAPAAAHGANAELLFFPSGRLLKPACLGFDTWVADLCWVRALQYYGLHRLTDQRYEGSQHLFATITDLDPQYQSAYLLGAVVLAQDMGSLMLSLRNEDDVDVIEDRGRATINTLLSGERTRLLHEKRRKVIETIKGNTRGSETVGAQ